MTNPASVGDDREVESAVLAYLDRHPGAADTLDGIAAWWLPRQRYITARERIEGVLSRLVAAGVLQLRRLPDGTALYALAAARRDPPTRLPAT
ncbi:hypothetical protein J5226_11640 [Lysobacter sp. K5869]|uniref:hypothetical protein n=1 Tax=Lysobacter sp. K5869 TaxID=2820808 RepID=UPI001C0624FE|nr:hypothetical protein [Lysobacter sp. K5869]QWP78994.1 hypothetical protein J5226_11640 [Lysobacter sp. K5869]